jgi:hypothetical protein
MVYRTVLSVLLVSVIKDIFHPVQQYVFKIVMPVMY